MKLLVTGGAGFMGSNFIHYILKTYPQYEVVNFDKLTYAGNLANLGDIESDPRYTFVKGDIADAKAVEQAVQGVGAIINYAAETHVDRSIMEAREFAVTDVIGTLTLLQAVEKFKIPKMIQVSTDEVFGSIREGEFTEESPFLPNSPYSASKAGGDHMCRAFYATYGTPVVVTHSCNFYGPFQYPEKVIPLFITNLLQDKKVPLYGDGSNVREWIYTDDHCRAIDVILHQGIAGSIYNIGSGSRISNLELTNMIVKELRKDQSYIQPVKDRLGHDFRYAVACEPLRKLGWAPQTDFTQGIQRTIAWYTKNASWWKKLLDKREHIEYIKKQYEHR
ncbi:MAG: dTDP-glucose 4,6-dehydratase [Patescibacteria group bacterium]|jgi:dTDP-glucose 4,6-dehydratase